MNGANKIQLQAVGGINKGWQTIISRLLYGCRGARWLIHSLCGFNSQHWQWLAEQFAAKSDLKQDSEKQLWQIINTYGILIWKNVSPCQLQLDWRTYPPLGWNQSLGSLPATTQQLKEWSRSETGWDFHPSVSHRLLPWCWYEQGEYSHSHPQSPWRTVCRYHGSCSMYGC